MTILNFVTQDELDNLSEDPRVAFMELINHAQRRLSDQTSKLDPDNQYEWNKKFDLEKSFMNNVVAAGKSYEVEPFMSMEVPKHQSFNNSDYEQFKSDLDHYITQLVLSNSLRARNNSVKILPHSKEKIQTYVHGLKDCIAKSNMQDSMRKNLLAKLEEFEKELNKPRTNFLALSLVTIALIGAPGGTWASVEVANKLVTNIIQVFAEAKQVEDETRRIGPEASPKALSAPRPLKDQADKRPSWQPSTSGDMDDDIPF